MKLRRGTVGARGGVVPVTEQVGVPEVEGVEVTARRPSALELLALALKRKAMGSIEGIVLENPLTVGANVLVRELGSAFDPDETPEERERLTREQLARMMTAALWKDSPGVVGAGMKIGSFSPVAKEAAGVAATGGLMNAAWAPIWFDPRDPHYREYVGQSIALGMVAGIPTFVTAHNKAAMAMNRGRLWWEP